MGLLVQVAVLDILTVSGTALGESLALSEPQLPPLKETTVAPIYYSWREAYLCPL